jgi:O-methyltransferase
VSGLVNRLVRAYVGLVTWLSLPVSFTSFFRTKGPGLSTKLRLVRKFRRNTRAIPTASHYLEHLVIATRILEFPASIDGCVVECGAYKGGSAANLSLVCGLTGRSLEVFDSFSGLPEPTEGDRAHVVLDRLQKHIYRRGDWRGSFDEARENIARYGDASVVTLHAGYFEDTLPEFEKGCIAAFVDVDLVASLKTCLTHLWPLLLDGGCLFTHEARHLEMADVFFDRAWWRATLGCDAPGLIGAGSGLGLIPAGVGFRSDLAYTVKNPKVIQESRQTGAVA